MHLASHNMWTNKKNWSENFSQTNWMGYVFNDDGVVGRAGETEMKEEKRRKT